MEHKSPELLAADATIINPALMSRDEKLDRWARLLDSEPDRKLATLAETEWKPDHERVMMAGRSFGADACL